MPLEFGLKDFIDIFLVALMLFYCYKVMKESRSLNVFFGVLIFVEEACAHVVPLFRDRLDTPDPAYLAEKLVVLGIGALLYILLTALALRRSQQLFARQDL